MGEILYRTGAELVGLLPREIPNYTEFPAAVSAGARQPDAAKTLLNYLASPDAARVLKARGLEPPA